MRNFDTDLDEARAQGQRTVRASTTVPTVRETVTITRTEPVAAPAAREARTSHVGKDPADWTWENLRDYVVRQIESFHGPFPKEPAKIAGIFRSFHSRYGRDAGPIAVAAFELYRGRWKGSPISVTRFCRGSDQYFADPIRERLITV